MVKNQGCGSPFVLGSEAVSVIFLQILNRFYGCFPI